MANTTRNISTGMGVESEFYIASVVSGLVLLLVFVSSFVLSPTVLFALWKTKRLQLSVYRMIGLILFNEILIRLCGSPLIISSMLYGRWLYMDAGCIFYAFGMTWLGVTNSSLFTCEYR